MRTDALMHTQVSRRTRTLTMSAACVALFLIFLDNTVVNVALPTIQRRLGSAPDQLEWSVNAYVGAFAGLVLLAGRLGDRLGRRRLFILGLLIFAAGVYDTGRQDVPAETTTASTPRPAPEAAPVRSLA